MDKIKQKKSAVCLNGHRQTSNLEIDEIYFRKICKECGAEIIDKCPDCNRPLDAWNTNDFKEEISAISEDDFPDLIKKNGVGPVGYFCDCGKKYPWSNK